MYIIPKLNAYEPSAEDEREIRFLGDLQKLSLAEGDVLVLTTEENISTETAERIRRDFERVFASTACKCIVLGNGMKLGVVDASKAKA